MYKRAGLITSILAAFVFSSGAMAQDAEGDLPEFSDLDQDNTGEITEQDVQGTEVEEHFDRMDADGDGTVTHEEYEAYKREHEGGIMN